MSKPSKNIEYMDIAKAIGIILMVIGHSGSPLSRIIYLFHMPLFFFISGYFYKEHYTYNIIELIKKRIKTLYIPFVKYQLVFLFLHNIFYNINVYSNKFNTSARLYTVSDFIKNFINAITFGVTEELGSAFWFLVSLFTVNILFAIIRFIVINIFKEKGEYVCAIVIGVCFVLGSKISLPRYIDTSLVALLIFYVGYLYNRYEEKISMNIYIASTSLIILIINSNIGEVSMGYNSYTSLSFFIVSFISGIYLTIYISKSIVKLNANLKLLKYIGENTLIIVGIHFIAFKLISIIKINIYSLPDYMLASFPVINTGGYWWILYSIIGIFIPILVAYLWDNIGMILKKE